MTDEQQLGDELRAALLEQIVRDGDYAAAIGPFLFQVMHLEETIRRLVVNLFEKPGSERAAQLSAVIFTSQSGTNLLDVLARAVVARGVNTDAVRASITEARKVIQMRNQAAHRLPDRGDGEVQQQLADHFRKATSRARDAWMDLQLKVMTAQVEAVQLDRAEPEGLSRSRRT